MLILSRDLWRASRSSVDAVLHVEIRLSLCAVAEDFQMIGMFGELLIEIEHVAVRVALAENRDEAEDVALESVAFAVGVDEAFAGELRRGVERSLNRERVLFWRGDDFRLAVNPAGGRKRDAFMPFARMASSTLKVAKRAKSGRFARLSLDAPGRIRTCDLRIRSPLLYPAELRGASRDPRGSRQVGAAGFEPATFRPQTERATRLRHAPTEGKYGEAASRLHRTSVGKGAAALKPRGAGGRGGPWGPCSLALATASSPLSLSWPCRRRPRRGPTAARPRGRGRPATGASAPTRCPARQPSRICAQQRCAS